MIKEVGMDNIKIFEGIDEEERKQLFCNLKTNIRCLKKEEYVFHNGDKVDKYYCILEGGVILSKDSYQGKRDIIVCLNKGECFGEFDMSESVPKEDIFYDAVCSSDVKLLELSAEGDKLIASTAFIKFMGNIIADLNEKNRMFFERFYDVTCLPLRLRLAAWILKNSCGRDFFETEFRREDIADCIGTTRPSLSRELNSLQAEGLICLDKRKITIKNRALLEAVRFTSEF